MRALLITQKGAEQAASGEVAYYCNVGADLHGGIEPGKVFFTVEDPSVICKLCYLSQSAKKVMKIIESNDFKDLNEILAKIKKIDKKKIQEWLDGKTFAVRSMKEDEQDFSSQEIEERIGEYIYEEFKAKVDLENPDVTFLVYVHENQFVFGIDFCGFDMSKRNYRMFHHVHAVKGNVAFALLINAGFDKEKMLLDPFAGAGTIPIEAAFFASGFPVNYYNKEKFAFLKFDIFKDMDFDKFFEGLEKGKIAKKKPKIFCFDNTFRNVNYCQKNAKIAGVNKFISFSRQEIDNLDIKFDEKSVDCIVTAPPEVSKRVKPESVKKILDEFFYNAKYILAENGRIVLLSRDTKIIDELLKKHDYFLLNNRSEIWQGKERLIINRFITKAYAEKNGNVKEYTWKKNRIPLAGH